MELDDAVEGIFKEYPELFIPEFLKPIPSGSESFKSPKGPK